MNFSLGVSSKQPPVVTQAGAKISLPCPGIEVHPIVLSLVWKKKSLYPDKGYGKEESIVFYRGVDDGFVEYTQKSDETLENRRVKLLTGKDFSLQLSPVIASDSAEFMCIINKDSEDDPDRVIHLVVQGKVIAQELLPYI